MECGANVSYLSAFPGEQEFIFPPLTYLKPTKRVDSVSVGGGRSATVDVVEVSVVFPS